MSWRKEKTSGWASFHPVQQWSLEPETSTEYFPSVSSSAIENIQNNVAFLNMPFKSVLQNSLTSISTGDLLNKCEKVPNSDLHKMLKEIYPWVDESLIMDILAQTDNNLSKTTEILKEMFYLEEENSKKCKDVKNKDLEPITDEGMLGRNDLLSDGNMDIEELTCLVQEGLKFNNSEFNCESDTGFRIFQTSLNCLTIEPEWEEDDVYLVHRREAFKKQRLASRHSKAAKDAYLRGDHISALEYSQKAQKEWKVAKRLNDRAAKEILHVRNSKNDQWTLDLHGLHSAEAVIALQEHLSKIESQISIDQLVCTNGVKVKSTIVDHAPYRFAHCYARDKSLPSESSKPTSLQVITGRGNHSRGEASLPTAIKSFLKENGYHFEETRVGVISVLPKKNRRQLR